MFDHESTYTLTFNLSDEFQQILDEAHFERYLDAEIYYELLQPHHISDLVALYKKDFEQGGGNDDMYYRYATPMGHERFKTYLEFLIESQSVGLIAFDPNGSILGIADIKQCYGDDISPIEGVFDFGVIVFQAERKKGYGTKLTTMMLVLGMISERVKCLSMDLDLNNPSIQRTLKKFKEYVQRYGISIDFKDILEDDYHTLHRVLDCAELREDQNVVGNLKEVIESLIRTEDAPKV